MEEVPLPGGRTTPGVVRIGDTVHRPPSPNSDFVRRLLDHLGQCGFAGCPRPLGIDEYGRDVFTFIQGEVPVELGVFEDAVLAKAAALIRRYHDLSSELVTSLASSTADVEVVCHNDLSPCNFVFREDSPVAIIDFDAVAPGTRTYDLGYAAWLWLDFGSDALAVEDQRRRLALFLRAYGMTDARPVLTDMLLRQQRLAARGRDVHHPAMTRWAEASRAWTLSNYQTLAGD